MNTPQPISGHKGRDRWMRAILARDVLPLLEVRVAVRLGIFFNCKTGKCDPGYDTLASELGISRRTLFRAIARLKADGWIKIHRIGSEYVLFSLLIPPVAGANIVARAGGANIVAPAEPSKQVTENEGAGDTQAGRTKEPENLKEVSKQEDRDVEVDRPPPTTVNDRPSLEPRARAGTECHVDYLFSPVHGSPPSSWQTASQALVGVVAVIRCCGGSTPELAALPDRIHPVAPTTMQAAAE